MNRDMNVVSAHECGVLDAATLKKFRPHYYDMNGVECIPEDGSHIYITYVNAYYNKLDEQYGN